MYPSSCSGSDLPDESRRDNDTVAAAVHDARVVVLDGLLRWCCSRYQHSATTSEAGG
jgi:hypothetical protein